MTRPSIDPDLRRSLTQLSPYKSVALTLAIYAAAVGLAWLGSAGSGWWLAVPSILIIAGLQNHLLILLHECAHVLIARNRKANDLFGDIFFAVPFFTLVRTYRIFHLLHHKYSGSPELDPEVAAYRDQGYFQERMPWPRVLRMLALDLSGYHFVKFAKYQNALFAKHTRGGRLRPFGPRDAAIYLVVWGGVGTLAVVYGFWLQLLVFWILPIPTVLFLLLKLHGYGEHTGARGPSEFERTWIHAFNPVTDFFIYPINSGYHLEHHLFPKVPWYNAHKLRRALLSQPEVAARADPVTATGYFFGRRTIWASMLAGEGVYRAGEAEERAPGDDAIVTTDVHEEVDVQLGKLA